MEYVLLELKILYDNPNNRGIPKPLANLLSLRGIMAGTDGYSVLLLSRERYNERHLLKKKKKKKTNPMHRGGSMCFSNVLCNSIFVTRTRRFPFIYMHPACVV